MISESNFIDSGQFDFIILKFLLETIWLIISDVIKGINGCNKVNNFSRKVRVDRLSFFETPFPNSGFIISK